MIILKNDAKCEGKLTGTFKNDMRNLANFHRMKNTDITLESKMVKLKQNKILKQANPPDAV